MIKNILVAAIIFLAVLSVNVVGGDEEYPILDKQVEIRQVHLIWKTTTLEIIMEAAIDYIDEISNGTGSSKLSSILNNFKDQTDLISTLTTHVALNNAIRQLIQITTDFRLELRDKISDFNGGALVLLNRIQTALNENESTLNAIEDTYWQTRKTNALAIFDTRINNAQNILDILTDRGYNTSQAQGKLDEIKSKRTDLENALDQRDNTLIHSVNVELYSLSQELREIVRDLQIQIPLQKRVQFWIRVGERAVDRTGTIISELGTLGIDVTDLQEIHNKAESDLAIAQEKYSDGNMDGAKDALHDLKSDLIELRDAYEELIFGGILSGDIKVKVEGTSEALTDTIDAMQGDL